MQGTLIALSAALVLGLTTAVAAQEPADRAAPPSAVAQPTAVDVGRLPVDLSRLQRQLRTQAERQAQDGLRLRYFVDVYAPAPPIILFTPQDDLTLGPVPNSSPSHREMIEHVTPREYRAPAADFSALLRWLKDRKK
jgi:hypothetical protein